MSKKRKYRLPRPTTLKEKLHLQAINICVYSYTINDVLRDQYYFWAFLYTPEYRDQAFKSLAKVENKIDRCISRINNNLALIKSEKIKGITKITKRQLPVLKEAKTECKNLRNFILEFNMAYTPNDSDSKARKNHLSKLKELDAQSFEKLCNYSIELGKIHSSFISNKANGFGDPILGEHLSRITEIIRDVVEMNISSISQDRFIKLAKELYIKILDKYSFSYSFKKSINIP